MCNVTPTCMDIVSFIKHLILECFLINSVVSTLSTKDNLGMWGKSILQSCGWCGNWANMAHVLSGCPLALDQGLYIWRHDSVLFQVEKFTSQTLDSDVEILCDAGDRPWIISPDIVATSDRPYLVIVYMKSENCHYLQVNCHMKTM